MITAQAIDGFGNVSDWPIEIVGVTSGYGQVIDEEVLAGQYTIKVTALGRVPKTP